MKLDQLNGFHEIVLQCHDNPDADAIASGFALYLYFLSKGKNVRFIYSGAYRIQKANLRMMIEELKIPITYVTELLKPELLITVDCQYGEGNVTKFEAKQVAIIDHHEVCCELNEFTEIRSNYSSCSTLVYSMLLDAGYQVNQNKGLATALYYGLYMDTNYFSEIKHPLDMDMIETLTVHDYLIDKLKNSNYSLVELKTAGLALSQYIYDEENRYAIVKANPCDPNILGFISDLVLQVENIDACVVYNESDYGYKMSVRSCMREATANDIAMFITDGIGNGGGHKKKAGGFVVKSKFQEIYSNYAFETFIQNQLITYFNSYEIIDTNHCEIEIHSMNRYQKQHVVVGFVRISDLVKPGTQLNIRSLEGDVSMVVDEDSYVLIGVQGEVHPTSKDTFEASYKELNQPYELELEYKPTAKNKETGENYYLLEYARCCISTTESSIYARKIDVTTKVFTANNRENYMLGKVGDYLAVRNEDPRDAYIIEKSVFDITYQTMESK